MTSKMFKTTLRLGQTKRTMAALGAMLGLALAAPPAHADQAVVVGVNHYTNIPGADLAGCVNDATAMKAVLEKYHFHVTLLADAQATKAGITQTLQAVAARMKPNERFAFYFAGHGTPGKDKNSNLLPSDADTDSEAHDMSAHDLHDLVANIPASSRTVILDSCFSGGMSRGISLLGLHSRVFIRPGMREHEGNTRELVLVKVNHQDANAALGGSKIGQICYLTASRQNEQSGEDSFGGKHDGVFTHYLVAQMSSGTPQQWGAVQTSVGKHVNDYTQDAQHPTLSPDYTNTPVFGATNAGFTTSKPAALKANSLWDAYNADHANPFDILLTMDPDSTTVHVNDQLRFTINVGAPGYLIILEHGVRGSVNLLFPATRNSADAKVAAGKTFAIPGPDQAFAPDAPGTERVKAMLFTSEAAATAFLAQMPSKLSLPYGDMRSLPPTARVKTTFDTSDITFEVVPAP